MKNYLPGVLILSSILLLTASCSKLYRQGYRRVPSGEFTYTPVFASGFDKSLYQVEINFGKNTFTCLAIIKQNQEKESFRLAFFSEAGLRLFEMEFQHDGKTQINYVSDFLNKRSLVRKLSSDLGLLFQSELCNSNCKTFSISGDSTVYLFRVKSDIVTDSYFSSLHKGPSKIKERGCAFGRTTIILEDYKNDFPRQILFTHKMLNFSIRLKQIDYSAWN